MTAYVFPAAFANKAKLQLDAVNKSRPMRVHRGPHAGKMFLPAALAERDPRWVPLFQPLIADPANQVQLVELTRDDITPLPKP